MLKIFISRLLLTIVLQLAAVNGASAFANDRGYSSRGVIEHNSGASQLVIYQLSQNEGSKLRSRSDVIEEVKERYSRCEILKISLDERKQMYRVRVLMPNGKVRNLKISARR